jgi:hypothetical protein
LAAIGAGLVYAGWCAGYFEFQFDSNTAALRSLLSGLVLVVLSVARSWMANLHFSRAGRESRPHN